MQISTLGDKKFENPQTANLQKVLQDCLTIHDLIKGRGMKDTVEISQPKSTSVSSLFFILVKMNVQFF